MGKKGWKVQKGGSEGRNKGRKGMKRKAVLLELKSDLANCCFTPPSAQKGKSPKVGVLPTKFFPPTAGRPHLRLQHFPVLVFEGRRVRHYSSDLCYTSLSPCPSRVRPLMHIQLPIHPVILLYSSTHPPTQFGCYKHTHTIPYSVVPYVHK